MSVPLVADWADAAPSCAFALFRIRFAGLLCGCEAVPRIVVVHVERCAQIGQLGIVEPLVLQVPVHGFCGCQRQRRVDAREGRALALGASGAGGGQVEFGDGAFHDDVACGVPARNVHVRAGVEVQEHVVQHDVQIGASEFGRFRGVEARERCGVEADVKAVGGQRGIAHGERAQARERSVHEAQVHEQRVFRKVERLAGKRLDGFDGHDAPLNECACAKRVLASRRLLPSSLPAV